nr:BTB/POZ domain-containing protein At2g04740 [Ipomoea batatas]
MLLECGAICSKHTFDADRCHYATLNLKVRKLLKAFEARPPPLASLQAALRDTFLGCFANAYGYAAEQNSDAPYSLVPGVLSKVFKTAQSLAGEVAATTGDDGGGFVLSCLKDFVGCE